MKTRERLSNASILTQPTARTLNLGGRDEALRPILEARMEARLEALRESNERAAQLGRIREEGERRLAQAIGSEPLSCWRRYVSEQRELERRNLAQLSGASNFGAISQESRARRLADSRKVRGALAIDLAKVHEVHDWARARYESVAEAGLVTATEKAAIVDLLEVGVQPLDGHWDPEWLVFTPPYASEDKVESGWAHDFNKEISSHVDANTGQVGQRVRITNDDASDFDAAAVYEHSTNAVIFVMPKTGPLEVLVESQVLNSLHALQLEDEVGWSEASVTQKNWLTMQTFTAQTSARREVQMSHFRIQDQSDGSWNTQFIQPGDTFWTQFFSDRSFQEGELVWMDLGSLSYNYSSTNDVEVYSTIDFKWFLRQVLVRSTGV